MDRRTSPLRPSLALACLLAVAATACSDASPTSVMPGVPGPAAAPGGNGGGAHGKPDKGGDGGGGGTVTETFDAWDDTRWLRGDHALGLGYLDPANVTVTDGTLRMSLPADNRDGGEIRSMETVGFGSYEARIRAADVPGSLTAFFLYEYTESNIDEIDIEIIPDYQGLGPHVMFTTWLRSRQTNNAVIPASQLGVPFDITAFHTYRIETSRKRVRFFIDDVLVQEFTQGIPTARMYVMANAWWPWWLDGPDSHPGSVAEIDWIRY